MTLPTTHRRRAGGARRGGETWRGRKRAQHPLLESTFGVLNTFVDLLRQSRESWELRPSISVSKVRARGPSPLLEAQLTAQPRRASKEIGQWSAGVARAGRRCAEPVRALLGKLWRVSCDMVQSHKACSEHPVVVHRFVVAGGGLTRAGFALGAQVITKCARAHTQSSAVVQHELGRRTPSRRSPRR